MGDSRPLVSVVIPTFERPKYLLRAIQSVEHNDYPNVEIIIVDDNGQSTKWQKETENLLHGLIQSGRITYIVHPENFNGSVARNTGLGVAKGEYIIFLDDDDYLSDGYLSGAVVYLDAHPEIDAIYSGTILKEGSILKALPTGLAQNTTMGEALLLGEVYCNTSSWVFRKRSVEDINGFDENFLRHQDYEFLLRYFDRYRVVGLDTIFITKEVTTNVLSGNPEKAAGCTEYFLDHFRNHILKWPRGHKVIARLYMGIARRMALAGYLAGTYRYIFKAFRHERAVACAIAKLSAHLGIGILKRMKK